MPLEPVPSEARVRGPYLRRSITHENGPFRASDRQLGHLEGAKHPSSPCRLKREINCAERSALLRIFLCAPNRTACESCLAGVWIGNLPRVRKSASKRRRDGSPGNPFGQWTLLIEWSWRIEGKRRIWCGSSSDEGRWTRAFPYLLGTRVASIAVYGRLPEIDLCLSNGFISLDDDG